MNNILQAITEFDPLSYSAFAIYGIIAVYIVAILLCVKLFQVWIKLIPCMIFSFIGLALGAKLFGILSYAMYQIQIGATLTWSVLTDSGIVFYGGLIGYLLTFSLLMPLFFKTGRDIPRDIVAATIPLFHGFARIGCFFGGCCYGLPYSGPLCVTATHGEEVTTHFPIMLVESAFNFILFAALVVLLIKCVKLRGKLTRVYLWSYSIFRLVIEFFRGDQIRGGFWIFSFSQYVSMGILIYLVVTAIVKRRSKGQIDEPCLPVNE